VQPDPSVTGIDYLTMVAAAHAEEAGTGQKVDFTQLSMSEATDETDDNEQEEVE